MKNKIVSSIYGGRVPSYYDMTRMQGPIGASGGIGAKSNRFYRDHQNNYITHTGHVIKDYALPKPGDTQ